MLWFIPPVSSFWHFKCDVVHLQDCKLLCVWFLVQAKSCLLARNLIRSSYSDCSSSSMHCYGLHCLHLRCFQIFLRLLNPSFVIISRLVNLPVHRNKLVRRDSARWQYCLFEFKSLLQIPVRYQAGIFTFLSSQKSANSTSGISEDFWKLSKRCSQANILGLGLTPISFVKISYV